MTKSVRIVATLFAIIAVVRTASAQQPKDDASQWRVKDLYNYLSAAGEDLSESDISRYCSFIRDSQDPMTGSFEDSHGTFVYSVKADALLQHFGFKSKYPLAVCEPPYRNETSEEVSERMSIAGFREWLDHLYQKWDAYGAGSLRGHFIMPHCINLKRAGKPVDDSPYVQEFRRWILENQKENGFWNRPDDSDFNGWNGMMKMDQAFGAAHLPLPHPEVMIATVLKHQDLTLGTFTSAGGCTNHNALHTLRHCSKNYGLIMWEPIFRAMEQHAKHLEKRYDPESGLFRTPPGFDQPPNVFATSIAASEAGNLIDYCHYLLDPKNTPIIAVEKQHPAQGQQPITRDRIRSLLVRATGLATLSHDKTKEIEKAKHAERNNNMK